MVVGATTPSVPQVKTSEKFQLNEVSLNVTQLVQPKITYHTEAELKMNAK